MVSHTVTKPGFVSVVSRSIKYSNKFMAFGWMRDPVFPSGTSMIPMAIANSDEEVVNVDDSFVLELIQEGRDYRLRFNGSKSKLIQKTLKVVINDGGWHFFGYQSGDNGYMKYFVDALPLEPEEGFDANGLSFARARTTAPRVGGGAVWSPYLYEAGQGVSVFHWRFKQGQNITDSWVVDLMKKDLPELPTT